MHVYSVARKVGGVVALTAGACLQAIRNIMPPVFKVESTVEARSTGDLPPPLNMRLLPPMMIVEKGESLAEFMARKEPDFFTSLQVAF